MRYEQRDVLPSICSREFTVSANQSKYNQRSKVCCDLILAMQRSSPHRLQQSHIPSDPEYREQWPQEWWNAKPWWGISPQFSSLWQVSSTVSLLSLILASFYIHCRYLLLSTITRSCCALHTAGWHPSFELTLSLTIGKFWINTDLLNFKFEFRPTQG